MLYLERDSADDGHIFMIGFILMVLIASVVCLSLLCPHINTVSLFIKNGFFYLALLINQFPVQGV